MFKYLLHLYLTVFGPTFFFQMNHWMTFSNVCLSMCFLSVCLSVSMASCQTLYVCHRCVSHTKLSWYNHLLVLVTVWLHAMKVETKPEIRRVPFLDSDYFTHSQNTYASISTTYGGVSVLAQPRICRLTEIDRSMICGFLARCFCRP